MTNEILSPEARKARMIDRAIGAVLASAAGDALGAPYEFGPALPDEYPISFGRGKLGHGIGEWTDDTSMAVPILQALARGDSLNDASTLGWIVAEWEAWSHGAPDIGVQTRDVISRMGGKFTEQRAREAAEAQHVFAGRSGGNGSLMRTGPVALGYLEDGQEAALVEAAGRIAQLTHWEDDNLDACALWCLAIRHAIRTGEFDIRSQLDWIPLERRDRWAKLIDEALTPRAHPRDFMENNGWVVRAFQGALAAINGAAASSGRTRLVDALERAVRGGRDTDTVAAIAGSLGGAIWGATQLPVAWLRIVHGWPGLNANELSALAFLATRRGKSMADGWPLAARVPADGFLQTSPRRHPHDEGVWLGSLSGLDELAPEVSVVVSLTRIGAAQLPQGVESIQVRLIDQPDCNANLDSLLISITDAVAAVRAEGRQVYIHCAEARSRTAAVAALYAIRHRGIAPEQAWAGVAAALPHFAPAAELREAVDRIASSRA